MQAMYGVKAEFLNLGDRIQLFEGAYSTATVVKINETTVTTVRPYIHIGDFEYIGHKVLHYTGIETCDIPKSILVTLLEKGPELK